MSYCTAQDVKDGYDNVLLAQLTAASGGTITDAVITGEATEQSAFMDSYFIGRYTVPVASPAAVLAILKPHAVRLTLAGLFQDRLLLESYASIGIDRDNTMEWLRSVRDGKMSLSGAPLPVPPVSGTVLATGLGGSQPKVFSETSNAM